MIANPTLRAITGAPIPIVQSGMGGVAQARLAAAVAEAGAAGTIGLYRHSAVEIEAMLAEASGLTGRRIGVNLVPSVLTEGELEERLATVLAHPSRPFVTFFGLPPDRILGWAGARAPCGVQVGTIADAARAFASGAAFAVLQTAEAGGHHLGALSRSEALAAAPAASLPADRLLLAGGIGGPEEVAAALRAGFAGVLCGTVFAAAAESHAHPVYKGKIAAAAPADTVVTDAFSIGWHGLPHRVIDNRSRRREGTAGIIGSVRYFGKRYPILRYSVAVPTEGTDGDIAEMALYCGTSCASVSEVLPARDIVGRLTRRP